MGVFDWFRQWATSSNRSVATPRHPDLHPIDVAKLAQELRLKDEAKRLAAGGIPAVDAVALSAPEFAAVQKIETYRQGYLDWAVARMSLLSLDLGKLNITADVNRALNASQEFERKAASLLTEQDSELKALSESARNAQKELERFRSDHNLHREARWPEGATAFMLLAAVVLLVIVEGALNAGFFAQGLDSGWLGGLTYAIGFAVLNVGFAYALGKWGLRYLNHGSVLGKLIGLFALAAALSLICLIGLSTGHFRDAMTAEAAEPARVAFETLKQRPFELNDMLSWGLFGLSVGFGIIALVDGYKTDDPYPGYGKISRHVQQVMGDYEAELEELRAELEELKNLELANLNSAVDDAQAGLAVYRGRIDEKDAAAIRLATALQNAENSVSALLTEFRNENELHRNSLPRPKYFDQIPALKELPFPDFSTALDRQALAAQEALVSQLLTEAETIRARIQDAFNNQYDRLKPLNSQYQTAEAP